MVVSDDPLDGPAHTVLAEAARLAGRNPAGTRDLLLAVLANRYTPVADVLRCHGVHLAAVYQHPVPCNESGDEKLNSGEHVTSALADAVRRAVAREQYAEHVDGWLPVTPAKLLVAALSEESCSAAAQTVALHVPPCRLRGPLDRVPGPPRPLPPGPEQWPVRAPRGAWPTLLLPWLRRGSRGDRRRLAAALTGPALLAGLDGVDTVPGLGWVYLAGSVLVLTGWGGALTRLRAHRLPHGLTALGGASLTLAGLGLTGSAVGGGLTTSALVLIGVATEGGVLWCADSGNDRVQLGGPERGLPAAAAPGLPAIRPRFGRRPLPGKQKRIR